MVAQVLGPSYISGCAHWPDIKDDVALIHATRMWIATKVVDFIHQFRDSIFFQRPIGSGESVPLRARIKTFVLPNKLRQQQKERPPISEVEQNWQRPKFRWFI